MTPTGTRCRRPSSPSISTSSSVDAAQPSLEKPLAVHRLAHHHLGAPAGEPAVVVGAAQRPIEPGRRHLQGVRRRHHVLDVEHRAQIAADPRAILDADALLGAWPPARAGRSGPAAPCRRASRRNCTSKISRPYGPRDPRSPRLEPARRRHGIADAAVTRLARALKTKKVGTRPLRSYTQAPNHKIIAQRLAAVRPSARDVGAMAATGQSRRSRPAPTISTVDESRRRR